MNLDDGTGEGGAIAIGIIFFCIMFVIAMGQS